MSLQYDTDDSEARKELRRLIITFVERNPEWLAAVVTAAGLYAPPATVTIETDNVCYAGVRALANDYLALGRYAHCANCMRPVAAFPKQKFDWPEMTPHECVGLAAWHAGNREDTTPLGEEQPPLLRPRPRVSR